MGKSYSELIEYGVDRVLDSASELQARDIRLLDVSSSCEFANFFILMTAQSPRHMRAVTQEIESELKKIRLALHHSEGDQNSGWALLDYGDLVVHLFAEEYREYYALEDAWPDAKIIRIIQ